jgi:hypothetical protein
MSQQLASFMEKLVREIQEGMPVPRRVRLMCEGTVFESWEPIHGVGLEPEQWARDAEILVQALVPELPKRRMQLSFVAEDSTGATLQTMLRTVTGQNANAQDLGTQNGAKALADAIASVAKTADAVLESARKLMEFQSGQIEKLQLHLDQAHEMFMAIKAAELESEENGNAASKIMLEQLQQASPLLMQLGEHWVKNLGNKAPAVTGGAAASVASKTPTNGAH